MGIFGKTKTPEEKLKEWRLKMKGEERVIERQIRGIESEQLKVKKSVKDAAKRGDKDICSILCKELVKSKKTVNKLHASKAQLNSVLMEMQHQVSILKVAGCFQSSTAVMQSMSRLIRVPEISKTMVELSKEMTKAGIMEEMIADTFQLEDESLEEEAETEVNKVLFEITDGLLGQTSHVDTNLPAQLEDDTQQE
eukprot:Sdes_comp21198_c0_seq1m19859